MNKFENSTTTLYYDKIGEGMPSLFIHPPGMGRRVFDYQTRLSDHYQVILPDFSGHGDSVSTIKESIITKYVDEIKMILDNEEIKKAVICGYSAGGMVAQQFALSYPDRLKAIILSGGYPKVSSFGLLMQYHTGMKLFRQSPDILAKILAFSHTYDRQYQKTLYHHMKKSSLQHWYQFYDQTLHYDCTDDLYKIKRPFLVMYGKNAYWMRKHKKYYEQLPNTEIAIIKNSYHQVPTKKWQAFNHIMKNFIQNNVL